MFYAARFFSDIFFMTSHVMKIFPRLTYGFGACACTTGRTHRAFGQLSVPRVEVGVPRGGGRAVPPLGWELRLARQRFCHPVCMGLTPREAGCPQLGLSYAVMFTGGEWEWGGGGDVGVGGNRLDAESPLSTSA